MAGLMVLKPVIDELTSIFGHEVLIMGLYALFILCLAAVGTAAQVMKLTIPDAPPAGTQTLSGSFQGYSMEVASFADMAGNLSCVVTTLYL
jgi:hypothetical protein